MTLPQRHPIHAEITGSDTATALGITEVSATPILALSRLLVEAGHNPGRPLECYRGDTLCLTVRSIGEAAGLEINGHGSGFVRRRRRGTAPPVRPLAKTGPQEPKRRILAMAGATS